MTFREIEQLLVDYFKRNGPRPAEADGSVYLGTCETCVRVLKDDGGFEGHCIEFKPKGERAFVSLTELAKLLEREMGR